MQHTHSFDAKQFLRIEFEDKRQVIADELPALDTALIFVFVGIGQGTGDDRFFILDQGALQSIIRTNHAAWLAKHGGIRPKNPESTHTSVSLAQLEQYRDNWSLIDAALS